MASTYISTLPSAKDRARLLLGDTGVDGGIFLLSDEEISAFLTALPFNDGVASLAESLAARFAQYPDETTTPGGSKIKWSERIKTWMDLAQRLRNTPNVSASAPRRRMASLGIITVPEDSKIR